MEPKLEENNLQADFNTELITSHARGTVKWFQRSKGFGYITRDDTKEDIYVHRTAISQPLFRPTKEKRRLNLVENEKVEFDVVKKGDAISALNVTGPNGYCIVDLVAFNRGVPTRNSQIVETRATGKVKWFNVKTKFGYIQLDSRNEEVYVNASSIVKNNSNKVRPSLAEGEVVEFDLFKRPDGKLEAVNVTGSNGTEVKGSEYAPEKIDKSNVKYAAKNVSGKCKWFNLKNGYGYIRRDDNNEDVYVHYTGVEKKNPEHRLRSLGDGEPVIFDLVETSKGLEAINVTGPNDTPVKGSQLIRGPLRRERGINTRPQRDRRNGSANDDRRRRPMNDLRQQRNSPPPPPLQSRRGDMRGNRRPIGPPRGRRMQNSPPLPLPTKNRNMYDYYNNDEPLYYTFKPKSKNLYSPNDDSRQIPYDRYMDMINRSPLPPQQQQYPPRNRRPMRNRDTFENSVPKPMIVAERVPGLVKWFNFVKGFGYITRFDNREDVYVHRTNLGRVQQKGMIPSLDEREEVEFDIVQDGQEVFAVNVTGPGGAFLRGSRYARPEPDNIMTKVYRRRRETSIRN